MRSTTKKRGPRALRRDFCGRLSPTTLNPPVYETLLHDWLIPLQGPTLPRLLQSSNFGAHLPEEHSVTVVVTFHTPETLCQQVDSLLRQSVKPAEIWVVIEDPSLIEYKSIILRIFRRNVVSVVVSDLRDTAYLLALQAPTKYVWFIDDLLIPGQRYLEAMLSTTTLYKGAALGLSGAVIKDMTTLFNVPDLSRYSEKLSPHELLSPQKLSPREFFSHAFSFAESGVPTRAVVDKITRVDFITSSLFIERDWIKLGLLSENTSQFPLALGFALRKHAGIQSYIMPLALDDTDTSGDTLGISSSKNMIWSWQRELERGGENVLSTPQPVDCLVVIDGPYQAELLSGFLQDWTSRKRKITVVVTQGKCDFSGVTCFSIQIKRDSHTEAHIETLVFLRSILESTHPRFLIALVNHQDSISTAIGEAVSYFEDMNPLVFPVEQFTAMQWIHDLDPESLLNWKTPKVVITVVGFFHPQVTILVCWLDYNE